MVHNACPFQFPVCHKIDFLSEKNFAKYKNSNILYYHFYN